MSGKLVEIMKSDSALVVLFGIIFVTNAAAAGATWWFASEQNQTRDQITAIREDGKLIVYRLGKIEEKLDDSWTKSEQAVFEARLGDLNQAIGLKVPGH